MFQAACALWRHPDGSRQLTIGFTRYLDVRIWADAANKKGLKALDNPALRTVACRCVMNALDAGFSMNSSEAFGLGIYVHEPEHIKVLQSKCKGFLRTTVQCFKHNEPQDRSNSLRNVRNYMTSKLVEHHNKNEWMNVSLQRVLYSFPLLMFDFSNYKMREHKIWCKSVSNSNREWTFYGVFPLTSFSLHDNNACRIKWKTVSLTQRFLWLIITLHFNFCHILSIRTIVHTKYQSRRIYQKKKKKTEWFWEFKNLRLIVYVNWCRFVELSIWLEQQMAYLEVQRDES